MKLLKNKKADMPWWLVGLIRALAILLIILVIIIAVKKALNISLLDFFKRW